MIIKNPLTIIKKESGEINIILPNAFAQATAIYTFKLSDTEFLMSSNAANCGLWKYDTISKTSIQVYSSGSGYSFFQETTNGVLFSSRESTTTGLYFYKKSDNIATKKYSKYYYWQRFTQSNANGDFLINSGSSANGFLKFDNNTEEVSEVAGAKSNFYSVKKYDDYTILAYANNSSSASGIWKYDEATNSFAKFSETSSYHYSCIDCKNNSEYTILSTTESSQSYLWNNTTKTLTTLTYNSDIAMSGYIFKFENYIITLPSINMKSAYEIDLTDFSITELYKVENTSNLSVGWKYKIIGNDLICASTSTVFGVLFYDFDTNTISNILSNASGGINFSNIINDKLVIYGVSAGLYLYNTISKQVSKIYTAGCWTRIMQSDYNLIFYGTISSTSGLLLYKSSTETVSKILNNGYGFSMFILINNDFLISCSSGILMGLWLFNGDTFTLSQLRTDDYAYKYELDGNNCHIKGEKSPKNILYYNGTSKTVKLTNYII